LKNGQTRPTGWPYEDLSDSGSRFSSHETWKAKNAPWNTEAFFAVQDETGFTAANERSHAALSSIDVVTKKIRELPASGFAGLAVKVRVVRFDTLMEEDFDVPEKDMDWGPKCFNQFAAEIDRLARA